MTNLVKVEGSFWGHILKGVENQTGKICMSMENRKGLIERKRKSEP